MPIKHLAAALLLLLPVAARAQDDAAYCRSLAAEYEKYYVKRSGHNPQSGPVDGAVAVEQCRNGNTAGIPVLEKKLREARVTLPARG